MCDDSLIIDGRCPARTHPMSMDRLDDDALVSILCAVPAPPPVQALALARVACVSRCARPKGK